MAPHASVKLDSEKARKYVAVDSSRMFCGAPECNFNVYKSITRLALLLYSWEKAHA